MDECYIPHLDLTLRIGDIIKFKTKGPITIRKFESCNSNICGCCKTHTRIPHTGCLCECVKSIEIIHTEFKINKITEI